MERDLHDDIGKAKDALRQIAMSINKPEVTGAAMDSLLRLFEFEEVVADSYRRSGFKKSFNGDLGIPKLGQEIAKYDTSVFQCLSDFEKCSTTQPRALCAVLAAICFAQQLIPFAGKK